MHTTVEQQYSRQHLFESIVASLEKAGFDKNKITTKETSMVDEFHIRGLEASKEIAASAGLKKNMEVLDVGCGVGGPARLLAEEFGCRVTGIDITAEYIRTATLLSALTGLQDRTRFIQANALELPFGDQSFDLVWTQHVQMNIKDKQQFYNEISRVLKPGGSFVYYDLFSTGDQDLQFPLPWADTAAFSHLVTIEEFHHLLKAAGLNIIETIDKTTSGAGALQALADRISKQGMPPVSLQLVVGNTLPDKLINLHHNFNAKKLKLESGICRKK